MNILVITACPTGIAHTYMAAEQLERAAKKFGHAVKVETQGAMGIENAFTEADIEAADCIIYATAIPVRDRERFANLREIEISLQEAIKNPDAVMQRLGA
jgi:fructose-specific phosphotransferase system IIB component